jgi:hypothetical protein
MRKRAGIIGRQRGKEPGMAVQTITEYQMFIAGEWALASGAEWVDVRNPASGEVIARVPSAMRADVGDPQA